jgi:hypothetical protein
MDVSRRKPGFLAKIEAGLQRCPLQSGALIIPRQAGKPSFALSEMGSAYFSFVGVQLQGTERQPHTSPPQIEGGDQEVVVVVGVTR